MYEYLDSFTIAKLQEIGKLVTKLVKNVHIENFVDVKEVALNPFMKLKQYVDTLQDDSNEKLDQFRLLNGHIADKFSGMICGYILENERKFKQVINKRDKIHKILRRI